MLRARMSKEAQARIDTKAELASREMDLAEVRRALKLSQEELADTLGVGQAAVAKLEKRTDMYVSTLRRFIEAMGGDLEIVARFPGHSVTIKNFRDLAEEREPA
jgi:predicted transcriptional regulator